MDILSLLWSRAEGAIDAMDKTFGKRIYAIAMNILASPQDAEECVNDTYLAMWNAIPPKKPEHFAAYLYRTARNIALNRARAKNRQGYTVSLDELEGCIGTPEDSRILGKLLNGYIETLSRDNRSIFLRRYWFGDSVKDIAKDFVMTQNTVSVRLSRMRDGLKTYLMKEGYYESETDGSLG